MKIYVGNLAFSIDSEKLKELFTQFGDIEEATVIQDKFSGRSKGFGFVTFKDDEAAKKAIAEMNDKEVEGRQLKVNEAKPMDPDRPRPPRRSFGNRPQGRDRNRSRF
ncbi:MAG: RNA-binding protein [Nanoarchaeota archaeon]|nr:RNA-binding protein [Nanoarchaeota archaeon]MBU1028453.1 RNA-binding protein [Nanoarchaeota archaeon]